MDLVRQVHGHIYPFLLGEGQTRAPGRGLTAPLFSDGSGEEPLARPLYASWSIE